MRLLIGVQFVGFVGCGPSVDATFSQVDTEVLGPSCAFSACHGGANGQGGLVLDGTSEDYGRLVGVASTALPDEMYVVPSDPDASYLVAKLRGDAGIEGDPMPQGSSLPEEDIALVIAWIEAGAAND